MTDQASGRFAASVSHISLMSRPFGAPRFHMDENASGGSPAPASDIAVIEAPAAAGAEFSVSDAARALAAARRPKDQAAESAEEATADPELSEEDNAAPQDEATGETQEDAPAEKPLRDLPRSWTKDQTERWNKLDPDMQDYLLDQDRKASAEVRRVQNETAEKLKGLTAKEQQAEQARQQYEERAKGALKILEREQLRDFPDIKTIEDVRNLSVTDPLRYLQWDAHQKEMVAAHAAVQEANTRQATEQQNQWTQHVQKENALAAEVIPDLADKEKAPALQKRAAERLGNLGFSQEELNDLASGKQKLSIYDHRIQQLIFSDLKLSDIQSAKTAAAAKPLPPVQRPGTARPQGNANSERIQALTRQLNETGSLRAAQELRALKAQRRTG
jgi:hypothetical protein